jgi:hypothetical protein
MTSFLSNRGIKQYSILAHCLPGLNVQMIRKVSVSNSEWASEGLTYGETTSKGQLSMSTSSIQSRFRILLNGFVLSERQVDRRVFGERVGFLGKFFGCWHEEMSRPFSHEKVAYRSCLKCGSRKQFDSKTLETFGAFYFPPTVNKGNIHLGF